MDSVWPTKPGADARCLALRKARDEREYLNGFDIIRVGYFVAAMPSTEHVVGLSPGRRLE